MSKITKVGNEYVVPVTLDTHVPPKSLPFHGAVSHALLYCAEKKLGVFLDLLPNKVEAANAKLWLKMVVEFASVRAKIVQSIMWVEASAETRFEVALELEQQGREVIKYLKKFRRHFNRAVEGVDLDAIAEQIPVPKCYEGNEEIARAGRTLLKEGIKAGIAEAWFNISRIDSEFEQSLLEPRKNKRRRTRRLSEGEQLSLFDDEMI